MAHVTEFTVEGLAGRSDPYSCKLNRHINIFFGLNGSGKTSLLKLLNAAMSGEVDSLQTVPFKRAQIKIYSLDRKKIYTYTYDKPKMAEPIQGDLGLQGVSFAPIFGTYLPYGETYSYQHAIPFEESRWAVEPEDGGHSWSHSYLPIARLYLSNRVLRPKRTKEITERATEGALEELFGELINSLWSSYSAEVLGAVQQAQAKGLADILIAILTGKSSSNREVAQLDPAEAHARVSKFLERQRPGSQAVLGDARVFQENYRSNPQLRNAANDISSVELRIQSAMEPRDRLQTLIERMFTGNKVVSFSNSTIDIKGSDNERIGLAHLSSGEKQLLRIFVETLMVGASSLLIDEPEMSMHVDWQRRLIGSMRQLNPSAQLVMATHSPEIMAEIPDSNIFKL